MAQPGRIGGRQTAVVKDFREHLVAVGVGRDTLLRCANLAAYVADRLHGDGYLARTTPSTAFLESLLRAVIDFERKKEQPAWAVLGGAEAIGIEDPNLENPPCPDGERPDSPRKLRIRRSGQFHDPSGKPIGTVRNASTQKNLGVRLNALFRALEEFPTDAIRLLLDSDLPATPEVHPETLTTEPSICQQPAPALRETIDLLREQDPIALEIFALLLGVGGYKMSQRNTRGPRRVMSSEVLFFCCERLYGKSMTPEIHANALDTLRRLSLVSVKGSLSTVRFSRPTDGTEEGKLDDLLTIALMHFLRKCDEQEVFIDQMAMILARRMLAADIVRVVRRFQHGFESWLARPYGGARGNRPDNLSGGQILYLETWLHIYNVLTDAFPNDCLPELLVTPLHDSESMLTDIQRTADRVRRLVREIREEFPADGKIPQPIWPTP